MKVFYSILIFVFLLIIAYVFAALPTMWLVNYLFAPSLLMTVFGVPSITFWQALGLSVLCGILFKASYTSSNK